MVRDDFLELVAVRIAGKRPREPITMSEYMRQYRGDCFCCSGRGKIVAPYEKPDVYEGYKLADRVTCTVCSGSGKASDEAITSHFISMRLKSKNDIDDYDEKIANIRSGLKKLNKEEAKSLGLISKSEFGKWD